MKNNNKADSTIKFTRKALTFLSKHTSLSEPEAVKAFIAHLDSKNGYKRNLCIAYNKYCKFYKIEWAMPLYRPEEREIIPPKKDKILMLMAEASKKLSLKIQLSMETGLRPIELCRLTPKDIHIDEKLVTPITAKNGAPRTLKISTTLATRIQEHIIKNNIQPNQKIFRGTADDYGDRFRDMRNNLAKKLNDPSIKRIRLYDLRHYFCTKKLYDIKNPYIVMKLMGHKKLETTQKYMHLLNLNDEEYIFQGATTKKEAIQLIEAGFQYVTTIEGVQLFKKRKYAISSFFVSCSRALENPQVESDQGIWHAKTGEQTIKPLEKEIEIKLPIPKNQLQYIAKLAAYNVHLERLGLSGIVEMNKAVLEKFDEARTIRIKGKNIDDLELQKIDNLIREATARSSRFNLRGLFKNLKKHSESKSNSGA